MLNDKVIILGGGLSGLRLGCRLLEAGIGVEIYEKEPYIGGLLSTFEKDGFLFDLGPHLYFPEYVVEYKKLIGNALIKREVCFGVGLKRKSLLSPVRPLNLLKNIGLKRSLPLFTEIAFHKIIKPASKKEEVTAKEWLNSNFGSVANRLFFQTYIPFTHFIEI